MILGFVLTAYGINFLTSLKIVQPGCLYTYDKLQILKQKMYFDINVLIKNNNNTNNNTQLQFSVMAR